MTTQTQQRWDATAYAREGSFVPMLGAAVLDWLAPMPGERVLDLGCGDGRLSLRLMEAGALVVGLDSSPAMVEAAQGRGVDARVGHAQRLAAEFETEAGPIPGTGAVADAAKPALARVESFDAVFSNAALHWVRDEPGGQDAMLRGVAAVLRPGGRFVAEMGGHGNIAAVRTALRAAVQAVVPERAYGLLGGEHGENYFPTEGAYRVRLEQAGLTVERMALMARPTVLAAGGIRGWYRTFRNAVLAGLTAPEQEQVLGYAEGLLAPVLCDADGRWIADYVRLRFIARKRA
jgi:SAM-dependent methyltransferase